MRLVYRIDNEWYGEPWLGFDAQLGFLRYLIKNNIKHEFIPSLLDESEDKCLVTLEETEKEAILRTLKRTKFNQRAAAELLEISPRKLNFLIDKYKINHETWKKKR